MKKIFLDIGAHTGETLAEVIRPVYGFDQIVCFEPSPQCFATLERFAASDPRIVLCRFGLGDGRQEVKLYGSGQDSASTLGPESASHGVPAQDAACDTVLIEDAAAWVREHLNPADLILCKINCEGGEIAILNSWTKSGLIEIFYSIMITFDIRNFKPLRHQEGELRAELRRLNLANTCFADDVMIGPTHGQRIAHWLHLFGVDQPSLSDVQAFRLAYAGALRRYANKRGYRHRAELVLKEALGYGLLPAPAKLALRGLKAKLGLSAEQR
jgi:FkbM family methyltransferase